MTVRPEVAAPVLLVAGAYAVGWWQLRRRGGRSRWRVAASVGGWLGVLVALSAPLDRLAHASFAAHMVQHLLLVAGAAPSCSWPILSRRSAGRCRRRFARAPDACFAWGAAAPVVARATTVSLAWLTHVAAFWLWHLPRAYDAAVADRVPRRGAPVFFGTAALFWWPIIQPAPRPRPPAGYGIRVSYLVLAALQGSLLGLLLTMTARRGTAPIRARRTSRSAAWSCGASAPPWTCWPC
jgi:cytochrome c oxidase assembly factor CtaG